MSPRDCDRFNACTRPELDPRPLARADGEPACSPDPGALALLDPPGCFTPCPCEGACIACDDLGRRPAEDATSYTGGGWGRCLWTLYPGAWCDRAGDVQTITMHARDLGDVTITARQRPAYGPGRPCRVVDLATGRPTAGEPMRRIQLDCGDLYDLIRALEAASDFLRGARRDAP